MTKVGGDPLTPIREQPSGQGPAKLIDMIYQTSFFLVSQILRTRDLHALRPEASADLYDFREMRASKSTLGGGLKGCPKTSKKRPFRGDVCLPK